MSDLGTIGEDKLIALITAQSPLRDNVLIGPGDDCAVLKNANRDDYTLLKTDSIIEGVHYLPSADPYWVGWKAAARVVSDFAAMAGTPDAIVIALSLKKETAVSYVTDLYRGIHACAEAYAFSVVGGETSCSSQNMLTVSGTGKCTTPITRSAAQAGHALYLTGKIGGSIQGKHLTFTPRVDEAQWLVKHTTLSAMMDLSDGLAKDLPRLAKLSNVGYDVDLATLPLNDGCSIKNGISDGEDYELLLACACELTPQQLIQWSEAFPEVQLTKIGHCTTGSRTELTGGWEHFTTDSDD